AVVRSTSPHQDSLIGQTYEKGLTDLPSLCHLALPDTCRLLPERQRLLARPGWDRVRVRDADHPVHHGSTRRRTMTTRAVRTSRGALPVAVGAAAIGAVAIGAAAVLARGLLNSRPTVPRRSGASSTGM